MNEILTVEEMWRRFPKEWILIGDPEVHETLGVRGGTVLFHSQDRDEMYNKALELRPKRSGLRLAPRTRRTNKSMHKTCLRCR